MKITVQISGIIKKNIISNINGTTINLKQSTIFYFKLILFSFILEIKAFYLLFKLVLFS
jgi:hypothetical protein